MTVVGEFCVGGSVLMAIGTGSMEVALSWQGLFFLIGVGTIVAIAAWLVKVVVRMAQAQVKGIRDGGGVRQPLESAEQCERREESSNPPSRSRASMLVTIVVTFIVVERDVFETAVPWHELLIVVGVNSVAFMAMELLWPWCRKTLADVWVTLAKT